jgi:hypothetical protein
MNHYLENINRHLRPLREQLITHEVFGQIRRLDDLRVFMQHHVFAVWDFMSLLKALQIKLTCTSLPWMPQGDGLSRRLINEIVLEEESDQSLNGGYSSHFELYHQAMRTAGADISQIDAFLNLIRRRVPVPEALTQVDIPESVQTFSLGTWAVIEQNEAHTMAAAFTLGREEVIPDMFRNLISELMREHPDKLTPYQYYLERHIDLDEAHHTPMAMQMLENLCGTDAQKWKEVQETASQALKARLVLWDGIAEAITVTS